MDGAGRPDSSTHKVTRNRAYRFMMHNKLQGFSGAVICAQGWIDFDLVIPEFTQLLFGQMVL